MHVLQMRGVSTARRTGGAFATPSDAFVKRGRLGSRKGWRGVPWRRLCAPVDLDSLQRDALPARTAPRVESEADLTQRRQLEQALEWVESPDAVLAHGLLFSVLLFGSFPALYDYPFSQVPYFLSLATLSIYIGSHRSLDADSVNQISFEQSLLFPLFSSAFLFGFYLLMKYFPGFSIQTLVNCQFGIIGTFAVGRLVVPYLEQIPQLSSLQWQLPQKILHEEDGSAVSLSGADVLAGLLGFGTVLLDLSYGHHMHSLNNLLACSLAVELLQGMGIKSFKAASVLLLGLLIYDVFWVFLSPAVVGENVMMKVATSNSIEGPLKLLLPNGNGTDAYPFSILGLGDIAVPGILAALMLRVDVFGKPPAEDIPPPVSEPEVEDEMGICYSMESISLAQSSEVPSDPVSAPQNGTPAAAADESRQEGSFLDSRTYFLPVLASYVAGLLLASLANGVTHAGQPALLYIVPCMLSTAAGIAISRKEFWKRLYSYKDPAKRTIQGPEKP